MSKEAMKLALEALEPLVKRAAPWGELDWLNGCKAITALREALANETLDKKAENARELGLDYEPAQQQEPVAWLIWLHGPAGHFDHKQFAELEFERRNKEYPDPDRKLLPLYTSPPAQRTWVGLDDKDYRELHLEMGPTYFYQDYGQAIEAKLKEKNT